MSKKVIIVLLILLSGLIYISYLADNDFSISGINNSEKISLAIIGGPIKMDEMLLNIRTKENYRGYDEETLRWMESLGNKEVFMTSKELVIMDNADAEKIPIEYATDVFITYNIKCKVFGQHALGNSKYPKNVLYVYDVEFVNEEIESYET